MPHPLHYSLFQWLETGKIPLWVVPVPKGKHSRRKFHDHDMSEIVVILHGPGIHLMNNRSSRLSTGDVLAVHSRLYPRLQPDR